MPGSRSAKNRRAIVIGGSMSGLFSAAFLRQVGWDCDVYERSGVELVGRCGVSRRVRRGVVDRDQLERGERGLNIPLERLELLRVRLRAARGRQDDTGDSGEHDHGDGRTDPESAATRPRFPVERHLLTA